MVVGVLFRLQEQISKATLWSLRPQLFVCTQLYRKRRKALHCTFVCYSDSDNITVDVSLSACSGKICAEGWPLWLQAHNNEMIPLIWAATHALFVA